MSTYDERNGLEARRRRRKKGKHHRGPSRYARRRMQERCWSGRRGTLRPLAEVQPVIVEDEEP